MVLIDYYPTGNGSFFSNGENTVALHNLPVTEYRPNQLSEGVTPEYVFSSCQVEQLEKRPDLAIVTLPAPLTIDVTYDPSLVNGQMDSQLDAGIFRYFWSMYLTNGDLRYVLNDIADENGMSRDTLAAEVFKEWSTHYRRQFDPQELTAEGANDLRMDYERLLDLRAVSIPLTSNRVSYGPWYSNYADNAGMRNVQVDDTLVPWNFARSNPWYTNLDAAGVEKLNQSVSPVKKLDTGTVVKTGYPEIGLADFRGYNSNLTGINVSFGSEGISTTYTFSTFTGIPGTFRKVDHDIMYNNYFKTQPKVRELVRPNIVSSILSERF
jgi:hypothetical protein